MLPDEPSAPKADKDKGVEFAQEVHAAARAAFSSGQARAFSLDKAGMYYDGGTSQGCVFAVPIRVPAQPAGSAAGGGGGAGKPVAETVSGVITMLIEPRSKEAIRSTLAMAEVLAGYVHGHAARGSLRRTQTASFAFDLATRLIASINTAPNFKGACLQLVNELSKQFGLDRVALGWVKNDTVRTQAISDTEFFDRRMAMLVKLEAAMDECLDQEQPVVFPQPAAEGPGGDVLLAQAIVHSHRELAAGNAKLKLCSLPLRIDDDVVGVVLLEASSDQPIDLNTVELLQAAMDLVAPVLRLRKSDDRLLAVRAWDSTVKTAAWAVGPKHTVWKAAGLALLAAMIFVTLYTKTYRISADATLEPRIRRIISAPFDGQLKRLMPGIEPGAQVKQGQVLAELDITEYLLSLASANAKLYQAEKAASSARQERDQGKVASYEEQAKAAKAEADAYRYRIERSQIIAPIDGEIIAGDLKERVGSTLKLGDPLFQVASLEEFVVVAKVDERDIALVREAFANKGGKGQIATRTRPSEPFDVIVERIVPLAQAAEGKNIFELRGKLVGSAPWLRPGMEGVAKFDTEERSLLWIGTRRIIDTVRMWWW
jgi:multidrug resistance efflux pump